MRTLVRAAGKKSAPEADPMSATKIAAPSEQRPEAIKQWLSRYGNAIRDTQGGPFEPTDSYITTYRNNIIYVHILAWQRKNNISLPRIDRTLKRARALSDARDNVDYISLGWARQENGGLLLVVPEDLRGDPHTIFMLEMEGEN